MRKNAADKVKTLNLQSSLALLQTCFFYTLVARYFTPPRPASPRACDMSLDPSAVQQDAAEPLAAGAHDQPQAQMQHQMHAEVAEQGTSKASIDLESPPQHSLDSHAQTPSSDLGAGSPLSPSAPRHVVDPHQSQAAAGVTRNAQDSTAIPTAARTMKGKEKLYQRKTSIPECESVA